MSERKKKSATKRKTATKSKAVAKKKSPTKAVAKKSARKAAAKKKSPPKDFERMIVSDGKGWKRLKEETLFDGPYVSIRVVKYNTPTRKGVTWTIADRKSAVIVAPQTKEGKFVLVRQERMPLQRTLWEFPAGQIDDTNRKMESKVITDTVHRELSEETGYALQKRGKLTSLGYFCSSPGFTDEHAYLFLANPVAPVGSANPDEGEGIIECREFDIDEIRRMIAKNQIVDANTLAIYARLCARGLISPGDGQ